MRPDALHELIHSLSPNERRYFKLHALPGGGQADSNFMQLFEALHAQPAYDEQALKQAFAQRPLAQHLSSEKNYLYRLILRSLRAMNEEGDHRAQTRTQIENAILLFERGLYAQSQKALRRADKLAQASQNHIALLEIRVLERRLWKILNEKGRKEVANSLIQSQFEILGKLQHIYGYYDLYDRMFLLTHQKFSLREQPDHPDLLAIMDDPILHDMAHADSFEARHFYWLCQAWQHQLTGDHAQLYESFVQNIAWWEAHPTILKTEAARYVVTLSNYLHAAGLLERYDEFPAVFAKIRSAPQTHVHGDIQVHQTLLYYELLYYMNKADWPAALQTAQATVAFLKNAGARVAAGRRLAFAYNMSILYFLHADYRTALHWVNDIIDTSGSEMREDIQHFARILLVIIHFELEHWDILEYLHRSSYRYLFQHKQLMPYEQYLMDALNKLMQQPTQTAQKSVLHELRIQLEKMIGAAQSAPGIQELYCWIDSRLTHRTMLHIMADTLRPEK